MPATANSVADQVYYGLNISWGLGATDYTISGVGALFQSSDAEMKYDEATVADQRGNVKAWTGYNPTDTGTLEFVVTGAGAASGNAAMTYPTQGAKITIGAATDDPISGSNWIVQSVAPRRTNTDAAKITLKVIRYKSIT